MTTYRITWIDPQGYPRSALVEAGSEAEAVSNVTGNEINIKEWR